MDNCLPGDAAFLKVLGFGTGYGSDEPKIFFESEAGFRSSCDVSLYSSSQWVHTGTDRFDLAPTSTATFANGCGDCPSSVLRVESEHRWFESSTARPLLAVDFSAVPQEARSIERAASMAQFSVAPSESPAPIRPAPPGDARTESLAIQLRASTARTIAAETASEAALGKVAELEASLRAASAATERAGTAHDTQVDEIQELRANQLQAQRTRNGQHDFIPAWPSSMGFP
jgi:hypothetical protein